ncbi:ADP-ribosylation factor-like protein 13B isoform X1 [Scyliorhinus canicula]|uniref:ADP-ribosylation factor-like protein 13B isoform X1 n=1 Tax=Scyliorhinus canicula TaxID=7830 RepID=UPI0018F4DBE1|nr:ADP-ribosylation factor-like protein 13B isoform X1 [Scyliorhinus canicula]
MFSLITNCCTWARKVQEPIRNVTLLILGLNHAGKTAILKGIQKESPFLIRPNGGFSRTDLMVDRFNVTIFDLGGGEKVRNTWKNYYPEAHGFIFVVDSTDVKRMGEAGNALSEVLKHQEMSGKPVLVLANKQDKAEALPEFDIIEQISLGKLANENKSICHIEPCSATLDYAEKKLDKTIRKGLRWLLRAIAKDYANLCTRLLHDSTAPKIKEQEQSEGALPIRRIQGERKRRTRVGLEKQKRQHLKDHAATPHPKITPLKRINNTINAQDEEKIKHAFVTKRKKKLRFGGSNVTLPGTRGLPNGSDSPSEMSNSDSTPDQVRRERGDVQLDNFHPAESNTLTPGSLNTETITDSEKRNKRKKLKKKSKNKINSADTEDDFSRNVDLTAPLDLYRKALLALKTRPRANN